MLYLTCSVEGIGAAWTTKEDAHLRGRVAHPPHRAGCEEEISLRTLNTHLFHPRTQTFDFRRSIIFLLQTEIQSLVKSSSFGKSFSPTGRSGMSIFHLVYLSNHGIVCSFFGIFVGLLLALTIALKSESFSTVWGWSRTSPVTCATFK